MDYFWLIMGLIAIPLSFDNFFRRRLNKERGWMIGGLLELSFAIILITEFCVKHIRFIP